jgi:hypothetical protein
MGDPSRRVTQIRQSGAVSEEGPPADSEEAVREQRFLKLFGVPLSGVITAPARRRADRSPFCRRGGPAAQLTWLPLLRNETSSIVVLLSSNG